MHRQCTNAQVLGEDTLSFHDDFWSMIQPFITDNDTGKVYQFIISSVSQYIMVWYVSTELVLSVSPKLLPSLCCVEVFSIKIRYLGIYIAYLHLFS